jgi:hypothetical protein
LAAWRTAQGAYPYYWLTAPLRPLPSALIIGTMKGGTSTLNAWMRHHPQVMFSAIKEVHYFDECFERGERWYRTYFPLWEQWLGGRCSLEATPAYLYRASVVIPRMHALLPEPFPITATSCSAAWSSDQPLMP